LEIHWQGSSMLHLLIGVKTPVFQGNTHVPAEKET
jgi:hypothetical protein